ncbi:unnamed protein product [Schistosoma margrebowiei]|uniref:Uncharacterized protein n=1 Tax=Schistosoma margrebowiei TaxID=48269 RepID=A0A3P8HHB4_9TREM|nr:unnamed protein product [Schistosoma margrebowiei]
MNFISISDGVNRLYETYGTKALCTEHRGTWIYKDHYEEEISSNVKASCHKYVCHPNRTLSFYFKNAIVYCPKKGEVHFKVTDGRTWLQGTVFCPNVKKFCKKRPLTNKQLEIILVYDEDLQQNQAFPKIKSCYHEENGIYREVYSEGSGIAPNQLLMIVVDSSRTPSDKCTHVIGEPVDTHPISRRKKKLLWRTTWKVIKEALTSTCQEVLGLMKHHHKEWISIATVNKIKERENKKAAIINSRTRAEKVQAQAEYTEANKQVKRSIRADKKKYVEELATTAKKAAREGNMKQLYDTTKKLAGKYSKPERPVKDKEGKPITEIQQQRNRWVEYVEELLNMPAPMNPPDIEAAHTNLPIDVNPPTKEEIRMAVRQIKNGKSAGPDNIPAEALKNLQSTKESSQSTKDAASITNLSQDYVDFRLLYIDFSLIIPNDTSHRLSE